MVAKYHIIGGGIAGLTAAKYIKKRDPKAYVIVYDAAEKLGGRCCSYVDKKIGARVDNATHALLRANSEALKIRGKNAKFSQSVFFYDLKKGKLFKKPWRFWREVILALCNTPHCSVSKRVLAKITAKLFPFVRMQQVYFSENDLSEYFIHQLFQYVDEFCGGQVLKEVEHHKFRVNKLVFAKQAVKLDRQDQVIVATDAENARKVFNDLPAVEYSPIINIYFKTSVPLVLPQLKHYIGIAGGTAQWISVSGNIVSATISHAAEQMSRKPDELAREVWRDICQIRGVQPAFMPEYRVLKYPRATLLMTPQNNALRPESCFTKYSNLFLAGDWTMKNWPCSIEAAARSGKRAAKEATSCANHGARGGGEPPRALVSC